MSQFVTMGQVMSIHTHGNHGTFEGLKVQKRKKWTVDQPDCTTLGHQWPTSKVVQWSKAQRHPQHYEKTQNLRYHRLQPAAKLTFAPSASSTKWQVLPQDFTVWPTSQKAHKVTRSKALGSWEKNEEICTNIHGEATWE